MNALLLLALALPFSTFASTETNLTCTGLVSLDTSRLPHRDLAPFFVCATKIEPGPDRKASYEFRLESHMIRFRGWTEIGADPEVLPVKLTGENNSSLVAFDGTFELMENDGFFLRGQWSPDGSEGTFPMTGLLHCEPAKERGSRCIPPNLGWPHL
jgi:hypothetical protein